MGELISRDWVLKNLLFDVDRDVVMAAPVVDAESVRHAHWEWRETWLDESPEYPCELLEE